MALEHSKHYRSLPIVGCRNVGWAIFYTSGPRGRMFGEHWKGLAEREALSSWSSTLGAERAIWAEWAMGPSPHPSDHQVPCPTAVKLGMPALRGEATLAVNAAWPARGYLYSWVGDPLSLDEDDLPRLLREHHEVGGIPVTRSPRAQALAHAGTRWLTGSLVP